MILYLLRHGSAEAAAGRPDRERALTPEGIRQIQAQAACLRRAGLRLDRIYTSPYLRARQTAELVGAELGLTVDVAPVLQCGCAFDDAVALLQEADGAEAVMLVGHQPDLGRIVQAFSGSEVAVQTGTLVVLDVYRLRSRGAALVGLYDPGLMARVLEAPPGNGR